MEEEGADEESNTGDTPPAAAGHHLPAAQEQTLINALLDLAALAPQPDPAEHAAELLAHMRPVLDRLGVAAHSAVVLAATWSSAGSSEVARALVQAERRFGKGPATDGLSGDPVIALSLAEEGASRWPGFAAYAQEFGVRRVGALPLPDPGAPQSRPLGALVHYGWRHTPLPARADYVHRALARAAGVHLRHHHTHQRNANLQEALDTRVLIEQAKGILAERLGCTPAEAFAELRRYARTHQHSLHSLARHVVHRQDGDAPPRPPPGAAGRSTLP